MKLIVSLLLFLFVSVAWATEADTPKLDIGKGGHCVRDPQWMRKNHMSLILHQRDETVRKSHRVAKDGIENCVDCHASLVDNSVTARSDSFCVACHRYAAVRIDCFECHANTRKTALVTKDEK
jgi:[DsrC]-trisulfide reductase subunit J